MQTQSNIPYALVIGRKQGEKFLRVISHAEYIALKTSHNFKVDGSPVALVTPESRALKQAWKQVKSPMQTPYHYKTNGLYVDTAIVNRRWESMVVCGGLHDCLVHHDEMEAKIVYLTTVNAHKAGIDARRIASFIPLLVDAFADMYDDAQANVYEDHPLNDSRRK